MMKRTWLKGILIVLFLLGLFWLNGCAQCIRYDYKTVYYQQCQSPITYGQCTEWTIESREEPYCVTYERK
jgi:hypothetical protein